MQEVEDVWVVDVEVDGHAAVADVLLVHVANRRVEYAQHLDD